LSVVARTLDGMSGLRGHESVSEWVRPTAVEVEDLHWLAHRRHMDTEGWVSDAAAATAATVAWVWGGTTAPVTGRSEQPVTREVAVAEWWAAMAACDGGATPERQRRRVCTELGVPYWPPDYEAVGLEQGYAIYQTLSWLLGTLDGWERGRRPPLQIPVRDADGAAVPGDVRSLELEELVVEMRRRALARLHSSS
jgi:hypothetical protein